MTYSDMDGKKFGRLTVISKHPESKKGEYLCICDCGNLVKVESFRLRSGCTKSCGCLRREQIGNLNRTHGESGTRLYGIWADMKKRCYNPNAHAYDRYGGRGITMCDDWKESYESFHNWALSNGYSDRLSIDRINNDSGYSPDNCRWADSKTQGSNRSDNHHIIWNGVDHTLSEWGEILHIDCRTLCSRIKRGWPTDKVLGEPLAEIHPRRYIVWNGEEHTLAEWSRILGINKNTLFKRFSCGWSVDDAFTKSIRESPDPLISWNGEAHTISQWARILGINKGTLRKRFINGWSVEDALTKPVNKNLSRGKKI